MLEILLHLIETYQPNQSNKNILVKKIELKQMCPLMTVNSYFDTLFKSEYTWKRIWGKFSVKNEVSLFLFPLPLPSPLSPSFLSFLFLSLILLSLPSSYSPFFSLASSFLSNIT
jgi:hypothetical protein